MSRQEKNYLPRVNKKISLPNNLSRNVTTVLVDVLYLSLFGLFLVFIGANYECQS